MAQFQPERLRTRAGDGSAESLFDERAGIVCRMSFESLPPWEPQVQLVFGRLAGGLFPDYSDSLRKQSVSGHSLHRSQAIEGAFGEAIERTFASASECPIPSATDFPYIDLHQLPRFSAEELEHLGPGYGRPDDWREPPPALPVEMIGSDKWFSAPAQMVLCPYHPASTEKLFWEPTTTGVAAGNATDAARIAGLLEAIERDAVAVSWMLRIPGCELSLDEVFRDESPFVKYNLLRGAAEVRLAVVSLDIAVPVCLAAIYDFREKPGLAFGSAAALDVRTAATRALSEAALSRYTLKLRINALRETELDPSSDDPRTYQDHGLAWANPELAPQSSWLFGSRFVELEQLKTTDVSSDFTFQELVERVNDRGYSVYCCNLSGDALASMGWSVQKVLVPGLQPLNPGRYRRMVESDRLRKISSLYMKDSGELTLNSFIHPFC